MRIFRLLPLLVVAMAALALTGCDPAPSPEITTPTDPNSNAPAGKPTPQDPGPLTATPNTN